MTALIPWLLIAVSPAHAAFEWTHRSARSWVIGIAEAGWPADPWRDAGSGGARVGAAATRSRPFALPDLDAIGVHVRHTGRGGVVLGAAQLRSDDYRETRWTALVGLATGVPGCLGVSWSALAVESDVLPRLPVGHDLTLGWTVTGHRWRGAVVAAGAWRSPAARLLGAPRLWVATFRVRSDPWRAELLWREEESGSSRRLGVSLAVLPGVELRGAVASGATPLRIGFGIEIGALDLSAVWVVHDELPSTRVVSLGTGG